MALDHSQTYRDGRLRNLPHRIRLKSLVRACDRQIVDASSKRYADFGCSNGYLTHLLAERYRFAQATGYEFNAENLAKAQRDFSSVKFAYLNLNIDSLDEQFDFATCLETLEHVGDVRHALKLMHQALRPDGKLMITVPIEIGPIGLAKFLAKMAIGYDVRELTDEPGGRWRYFKGILAGRISEFRPADRTGWGTHFGFDYRTVDAVLDQMKVKYIVENRATTRFYIVNA
jgi:2-polyprenyl-3-methyl-5-hydroxy-6-metoxy-1,4-benzoquinol methylase